MSWLLVSWVVVVVGGGAGSSVLVPGELVLLLMLLVVFVGDGACRLMHAGSGRRRGFATVGLPQ